MSLFNAFSTKITVSVSVFFFKINGMEMAHTLWCLWCLWCLKDKDNYWDWQMLV